MTDNKITGSTEQFDQNWRYRSEAAYNHWVKNSPENQVQLAFRCHWEVFQEIIGEISEDNASVLEVGCGRGSLSSYFADAGWECTLLDYSNAVLKTASSIFSHNGHSANFVTGDANALPFPENSFNVTVSIGLLEHFEEIETPINEQFRVLKPGGWFIGYIVPERPDNLQKYFNWINRLLKLAAFFAPGDSKKIQPKQDVFRSDHGSEYYLQSINKLNYKNLHVFGMYSMPMISHSPEFPFTLLPSAAEKILTKIFQMALVVRQQLTGRHGWICSEKYGQAFLIAFQKPESDY